MSREQLLHTLYEAAELEHTLMCTYLYAAWSLKDGEAEGLSTTHAAAIARWKQTILRVAVEEMSHLVSVWNITVALGGAPRVGRFNFPLAPGALPASIVVKLAPFSRDTLQHFIFLERPADSTEQDGAGFAHAEPFARGNSGARFTPMPDDYATVGAFYATLKSQLFDFVAAHGEHAAIIGDPTLQLAGADFGLREARRVICAKTALLAFDTIVTQGEGASQESVDSHYHQFLGIRREFDELLQQDPQFAPAHAAATNPVLRSPPRPQGLVWLEAAGAVAARTNPSAMARTGGSDSAPISLLR